MFFVLFYLLHMYILKGFTVLYIYIYIYIYRERERERESIQQEINFICKSFRLHLYQLHIYNKILLQLSNLQIVFFTNFDFSLLQEWEYQYKKNDKKTVVTKLRETRLTMTNNDLNKSN